MTKDTQLNTPSAPTAEIPCTGQSIFSDNFLAERMTDHNCWSSLGLPELHRRLEIAHDNFCQVRKANNEENTRHEWIDKVLETIGWHYDREAKTRSGRPDYALFASRSDRVQAISGLKSSVASYYRHAATILEAKYWDRPLDNVVQADRFDTSDASGQLVRYLSDVDIHSDSRVQWAMLTNGRKWRLFWQRAPSRATNYYEVDLIDALQNPHFQSRDFARFQYFVRFFEPAAFIPHPQTGKTRLDEFVSDSETYAVRVAENLKQRIFDPMDGVFICFAKGFRQYARDHGRNLGIEGQNAELFTGTLTLLYRLLFLLYAESRDLLPVREANYFRYSLRRICADAAKIVDGNMVMAETSTDLWTDLLALFDVIHKGSKNLNVPVYNGGLFVAGSSGFFAQNAIYDQAIAHALDALARETGESEENVVIDYKALGVRQLGSIYEGLLEYQLRIAYEPVAAVRAKSREVWKPLSSIDQNAKPEIIVPVGEIYLITNSGERKTSGSYFTPDDLVRYIVQHVARPVLEERLGTARDRFSKFAQIKRKSNNKRLSAAVARIHRQELQRIEEELFSTIFDMRILDPAMGSGHFLVEAADFVADRLIDFLNSDAVKNALDGKECDERRARNSPDPENPILALIARQRETIIAEMNRQGVHIEAGKLTDNNLIKRMVMKRSLYGVDLNPMAVELAKLSLWLHSFTLGAPLSFLDHHLRSGNSLIGIRNISQVIPPGSNAYGQYQQFMAYLNRIRGRADATLAEVEEDLSDFHQSQAIIAPYRRRFDFRLADTAFVNMTGVHVGSLEHRYQQGKEGNGRELTAIEVQKIADVEAAARAHAFFHWELEFPEVFYDRHGRQSNPGFDAIIGNPPWERMKLQEIEFFSLRDPSIASASTAAERRQMIADLAHTNPQLGQEYEGAVEKCDREMNFVRNCGDYPLLGHGDINLYSLFVERALSLMAPHGRTGLLTPSGLASDSGSQHFFQKITESGRLAEFIDFENKKFYFPDVHASFKFAISIVTGEAVSPGQAQCAFFIHRLNELTDPERSFILTPADFALLNPNTRTCPVFRSCTDAEITKSIYRHSSILVNENDDGNDNPWQVRFTRMFDMTNDSGLFRTADQLEANGFWFGNDHAWHKGKECYLRLYEGKMAQMFDHRAARVVVDPDNLFRPARSEPTTIDEKSNPEFVIRSQFYLPKGAVDKAAGHPKPRWFFGYKDVTAPTNMRTIIAAPIPYAGVGNTFCLIQSDRTDDFTCLIANFTSYALDFVARQKVHGQHLNFFIVKQLPVLPPSTYERPFKRHDIRPWIRQRVLELTYTAVDMTPFAADLGYNDPPFPWNENRRLHLRCQLDALYFHLYHVGKDEVDYILETFPIVREHDLRDSGKFLTKELVLAYYNAYAAGDLDAVVAL